MDPVEECGASCPFTLPLIMRRDCPLVLRKAATSWGNLPFLEVGEERVKRATFAP